MRDYLIFRLYGPMVSWGDIAVGEYRPSFAHPTKSAVLGLLGAALGIKRDDEESLASIAYSYGFAVRVDAAGTVLRDYHTAQVPPTRRGVLHLTRKDELNAAELKTVLSSRDYYCDALSLACLWIDRPPAPFTLETLKCALQCPRFPLYLGRKSCPPALPLDARIVSAPDLRHALGTTKFPDADLLSALPSSDIVFLYWEELPDAGMQPHHTTRRRDMPLHRRSWQFSDRAEHCLELAQNEDR